MNLSKHTIEEKFEMLSFLQRHCKIGSFLLTRLKTKDTYQISFVNGSALKVRNHDLNKCLDQVIVDVAEYYYDMFQEDFMNKFISISDRELIKKQKEKITELEDKISELEDNYSRDIIKQSKSPNYFMNSDGERVYTNSFLNDDNLSPKEKVEKFLQPLRDIFAGIDEDIDEDKLEFVKKLKKQFVGRSKLFTEYELYKEIVSCYEDFEDVEDVINLKNQAPETFKKVRAKAYDRLYKRIKRNKK